MKSLFKGTLIVIFVLFFGADWCTGDRFRDLGDKTSTEMCYRLAEIIDSVREKTGAIFEDIQSIAVERVNGWRNIAKKQSSMLPFDLFL